MALDPRTPVIVGAGQTSEPLESIASWSDAREPAQLLADAVTAAEADAGARGSLVGAADSIRVVAIGSWRYRDPGARVAELLGALPRESVVTTVGGNSAQLLVNRTALDIQRGDVRVALLGGAEALATRFASRRGPDKAWLEWAQQRDDVAPDLVLGDARPGVSDEEMSRGATQPIEIYPLIEQAWRGHLGRSLDDHQAEVARLWARFSEVAAANPAAWSRAVLTADQIATAGPDNRMVGFPYTKRMCANMHVNQGAALIMCSAEAAEEAGVPRDRWVFPWSGADVADHWYLSERDELWSSPAIRAGGRAALERAGVGIDDLGPVDLYSCFPVAVEIAAAELGLDLHGDRPLTVTGGLAFAGGPLSNYVTHSIATIVGQLRTEPGAVALVTGLGWFMTKHAFGVYGGRPPEGGFAYASPQAEVDALPRREPDHGYSGVATVEGYTAMHDRDGSAQKAIVAVRTPRGGRTFVTSTAPDVVKSAVIDDLLGEPVTVRPDATFTPA